MGYNALRKMQENNLRDYGIASSVHIPDLPHSPRAYGHEAKVRAAGQYRDMRCDGYALLYRKVMRGGYHKASIRTALLRLCEGRLS